MVAYTYPCIIQCLGISPSCATTTLTSALQCWILGPSGCAHAPEHQNWDLGPKYALHGCMWRILREVSLRKLCEEGMFAWQSITLNPWSRVYSRVLGFWALASHAAARQACVLTITWVVVKNMVPFWIPIIIRHLIFRLPKKRT